MSMPSAVAFPKHSVQPDSSDTMKKTMFTMETLGIQLPPPGFRPQDHTTNKNSWKREEGPRVHINTPPTTHQMALPSPERCHQHQPKSFGTTCARFQAGNECTEDNSYFYQQGGVYRMDSLTKDDSQTYMPPYHLLYQDEQYPIVSHMTNFAESSPKYSLPIDYSTIVQDHQHSSSSSTTGCTVSAEESMLPGFHPVISLCTEANNDAALQAFSAFDPCQAYSRYLSVEACKESRQLQKFRTPHQSTKRPAARISKDSKPMASSHLSKSTSRHSSPAQNAPGRIQKPSLQPRHTSSIATLPSSRNELLSNLIDIPTTNIHSTSSQHPQHPQQFSQLVPPILLPSNVDSSGVPMKSVPASVRRPGQRLLGSGANDSMGTATSLAMKARDDYANTLSRPPDLLGPLLEEQAPPPPKDMSSDDPELKPHRQKTRFDDDLYTPRWVRGHGNKREGWCGICKPGRWLVLKNSAFWYDKSFSHGVSAVTGRAFDAPKEIRRVKRTKEHEGSGVYGHGDGHDCAEAHNSSSRTTTTWQGLCGSCDDWIPLASSKKKGTTWFRHAYKCQSKSKDKDASGDTKVTTISSSSSSSSPSSCSLLPSNC